MSINDTKLSKQRKKKKKKQSSENQMSGGFIYKYTF